MINNFTRYNYSVTQRAREIANLPSLDVLDLRKYLGSPLANEIRHWLSEQPAWRKLVISFAGVRAVTLSVAEELGPMLMQSVNQTRALDHRYPILDLDGPEPSYTFARAFSAASWACLAVVRGTGELHQAAFKLHDIDGGSIVVLGQLSNQMEQILELANQRADVGEPLTSDDLTRLDFLATVSPAARSKRLTELHARRLLAFRENPRNPKERLFTAAWRL